MSFSRCEKGLCHFYFSCVDDDDDAGDDDVHDDDHEP